MANANITLSPALLPWWQSGVEYLLAQEELPPHLSLCHVQSNTAPASQAAKFTRQTSVPKNTNTYGSYPPAAQKQTAPPPSSKPASDAQVQKKNLVADPTHLRPKTPPTAGGYLGTRILNNREQTQAAAPSTNAAPNSPTITPDHWPRIWQDRLAATRPASVLWTYWALGEDLCGAADATRRNLLQRLLADLAHPAGTHSFWPVALPIQGHTLEADASIFWSGVDILKARALVVMGQPAILALGLPPRLRPFQQTRHNGRMVIILKDVDFLAQETHQYDGVREFLRQALAPFAKQ